MDLYHATTCKFHIGDVVCPNTPSAFYVNATTIMDSMRPTDAPARKTALYCADSPEFACHFLLKQKVEIENINIYKVVAENPWKAVFALTHAIEKRINQGINANKLICEYWNPSKNWNFFEYLLPSVTVIEKFNNPIINSTMMSLKYSNDFNLAANIS